MDGDKLENLLLLFALTQQCPAANRTVIFEK